LSWNEAGCCGFGEIQKMRKHLVLLVALTLCLTGLDSTQAFARFTPQPCKNAFTPQQEIAEGQKAKAEIYKSMPVLAASNPVTLYVQRLGAKLVAQAPGYKWPYEFHVINQAEINAFALPGGQIFVNLATIQAAETEAQLAGVLAHEISHVVQRHATCNATKQQQQALFWGLGQVAAGIFLPGAAGTLAQTGIGAAAGLGYLRMSRDSEKQADLMGTDILYDANYDPRAMPQFFEIIQSKYGEGGAQLLSDHPNPGNRVGYVQDEIETLPPKSNYVKTTAQFKAIHQQASAMHAYTAQEIKSGAWKTQAPSQQTAQAGTVPVGAAAQRDDVAVVFAPSGGWSKLNTADYTLNYPDNWHATNGSGTNVTIAPQGGVSANGISYGVLVESFAVRPEAAFDDAFMQLLRQLSQQNPGLVQSGAVEDVLVNGIAAKSVELIGRSALARRGQALKERDWLVAIQRQNGIMTTIIFIAPEENARELRPTFEQILRSFKTRQ
jgi:beta-barrel assembly-enhancing protease